MSTMEEKDALSLSLYATLMSTMEEEDATDLISELPDSLIHHILSFLDMVYVVPTCVLAKRWRYLWTSMPYLCFDIDEFEKANCERFDWYHLVPEFFEFIDKVMSVRNRSSARIHTFCLRPCRIKVFELSADVIERWFNILVQHNVVVLDFAMNFDDHFALPRSLLNCKSIEMLSINLDRSMAELTLELPNIDLPALRKLHLEDLIFRGEDISNLISNSPVLETLEIENCEMRTYNLIINAPHLKYLRISWLVNVDVELDDFAYVKIHVFAPILECFSCDEAWIMCDLSLSNVCPTLRAEMKLLYCNLPDENDAANLLFRNVRNGLAQISKVKALYLALPDWLLQVVFVPRAPGCDLHILFYNLTILKLRTWVDKDQTEARSYILEMCPKLETLILHIRRRLTDFVKEVKLSSVDEEYLMAKLPLECISHHLKFVELGGSEAIVLENEFAFIHFLLQNALVLETVHFHHTKESERSRVIKFVNEVKTITSASPNVEISLLDWSHRFKF